ncbi:MAG: hypothetical protein H6Q23_396 [Bacteroidetes bacterium]|nr:hypothetical protein [Bacteroidota bacterium]
MKCFKYSALLAILISFQQPASGINPDLETVRQRVINNLLSGSVNEIRVKNLFGTLSPDGSWPDINYTDLSRTGFQNAEHLSNLLEMSRAYKMKGSPLKGNRKLRQAIISSLDYWLEKDFICENWWYNQIGVPDNLVGVLLVMDKDLSEYQVARALPIAGRANLEASGARVSGDRIKIAVILANNALFQRNESLFESVNRVIEGEIRFTDGRGLQYDYSFHHRDDKVICTLSYGLQYADEFADWAALVSGTRYRFGEASINQVIDYYLDGICQSMIYGKYPDPGAKNRDISRRNALRAYGTGTPDRLLQVSDYRKAELENIVKIRKNEVKPNFAAARFFWHSEYFTHQRPDYFTSVRMFSSRNHNMEMPYNMEGLMNHHYADGSNFISPTGEEYYNIWPVYDWQKIPGTTVVQKPSLPPETEIQKRGLTEFVGAVTNGKMGAAVFDFKCLIDPLSAKKSWFFFEKEYVCLGTGIDYNGDLPVVTTLNQCLLKGDVVVMQGNNRSIVSRGDHDLQNVKWIIHDNVAPSNAGYSYIVVPSVTEQELSRIISGKNIEILANDTDMQAVKHIGLNVCQMVFYKAGEISVTPDITISVDSPGLIMIRTEGKIIKEISVSDPSRRLGKIHFSVSVRIDKKGSDFKAIWDEVEGFTEISVDLPQGVYAGRSVTVIL